MTIITTRTIYHERNIETHSSLCIPRFVGSQGLWKTSPIHGHYYPRAFGDNIFSFCICNNIWNIIYYIIIHGGKMKKLLQIIMWGGLIFIFLTAESENTYVMLSALGLGIAALIAQQILIKKYNYQ